MSEEVENSAINVPKAIIYAVILNGALGFAMLIAVLFSGGDLYSAAQSDTSFPYTIVFSNALAHTGGVGAAVALSSIIVFLNTVSAIGCIATASRMLWSFARDKGVPGWMIWRKVSCIVTVAALIGLINVGSTTAFEDVVSLILEGFYSSYLIAISLLLYRRVRGEVIDPASTQADDRSAKNTEGLYFWGPWRIKGILGIINNALACAYLTMIIFFGFWPASKNVTSVNMNYSVVIMGGITILSVAYYFFKAKRQYNGPIVEVEVQQAAKASF
ncbi:MAG: hypothetical protein Q9162_000540 [Coniocarpon cinnabarinum]